MKRNIVIIGMICSVASGWPAAFAAEPDLCDATNMGRLCWDDALGVPTGNCFTGSPGDPGEVCTQLPGPSVPPDDVERFIWVGITGRGPNHLPPGPTHGFSNDELCALAARTDLIVIERGHGQGDLGRQGCAVRLLKALQPNLRALFYFRGEKMFEADPWWPSFTAIEPPDLSWRLVDEPGKHWVDTSDPRYRSWAVGTVVSMMDGLPGQLGAGSEPDAPWDGVAFDLSYGYMHISNLLRSRVSGVDPNDVFEGVARLARETQQALDALPTPGKKIVFYNGITAHMSPEQACTWRHTRPLAGQLDSGALCGARVERPLSEQTVHATGALNEYFCREKYSQASGPVGQLQDPDFLRRDLEVQRQAAESGSWMVANLQYNRTQWASDPPAFNDLDEIGLAPISRYCYASYLMAHVPGRTVFKRSGRTDVRSIGEVVAEEQLDLGSPVGDMIVGDQWPASWPAGTSTADRIGGGLLSRAFENHWVVANLDPGTGHSVALPETLTQIAMERVGDTWVETQGASLVAGDSVLVPPSDAIFFSKPKPAGSPPAGGCSPGLSPSGYTGGNLGWLGRERTSFEGACCNLSTSCARGQVCYPEDMIVSQAGDTDDVCLDATGFGPAFYTCDASRVGQVIPRDVDGALVDGYRCARVCDSTGCRYRFEPPSYNLAARPASQGCAAGQNVARFMGAGFGQDWRNLDFLGRFERCCNPLQHCNQGTCFLPGNALPWNRSEDQVCSHSGTWTNPQGIPVATPAVHTCTAGTAGLVITDRVTRKAHCCTAAAPGMYRFEHPAHEACAGPVGLETCPAPILTHDRMMAAAFGTAWSRAEAQGSFNACCDPARTCNGGDVCLAPGTRPARQRQGTDLLCADVGAGPAFYLCDARNAGATLSGGGGASWCCQDTTIGGDTTYGFVAGACP